MASNNQLENLIEKVQAFVASEIFIRNENGTLDGFLQSIGFNGGSLENRLNKKEQKILIVGDTQINENVIVGIFKKLGVSKNRIELISDYDKITNHNFDKYSYNDKYAVIMFGPIPHSVTNKEEHSSIITKMENEDGYPPVYRLNANRKLKITNSNLRVAIEELIETGILIQNL